jgi:GxxExxY protein
MKSFNHEEREGREDHEDDSFSVARMRAASPLSPEAERVMHATIGCAIAVHRTLGPGFLESIYKKAMCIELETRKLGYECERSIDVVYRGMPISGQRIDLIIEGLIVVELKAVAGLEEIFRPSCSSWFKASECRPAHRCVQRAGLTPGASGFAPRPRPPTSRYTE